MCIWIFGSDFFTRTSVYGRRSRVFNVSVGFETLWLEFCSPSEDYPSSDVEEDKSAFLLDVFYLCNFGFKRFGYASGRSISLRYKGVTDEIFDPFVMRFVTLVAFFAEALAFYSRSRVRSRSGWRFFTLTECFVVAA